MIGNSIGLQLYIHLYIYRYIHFHIPFNYNYNFDANNFHLKKKKFTCLHRKLAADAALVFIQVREGKRVATEQLEYQAPCRGHVESVRPGRFRIACCGEKREDV
jgi:hypothetical protein